MKIQPILLSKTVTNIEGTETTLLRKDFVNFPREKETILNESTEGNKIHSVISRNNISKSYLSPLVDGFTKIHSEYQNQINDIYNVIREPLDTKGIMEIQVSLYSFVIQQDIMAKTISKSSQIIETLMKLQ